MPLLRRYLIICACTVVGSVVVPTTYAAAPIVSGSSLEARLARVERQVGQMTDLMMQVDSLKRENQQLRGELEVQQHTIESMKQKQRDLYLDIDQRLGRVPQAPAVIPPVPARHPAADMQPIAAATVQARPAPALQQMSKPTPDNRRVVEGVAPVAPAAEVVDLAKERASYQAAYDLLRPENQRYQEAIVALRDFITQYPASEFTPNAQYWLAEANYVTQDNASAILEFQKVVDQFPGHPKTPGALLKIGYIQHAEGKLDEARESLNQVIRTYPTSSAAGMAQQRLARIASEVR